MIHGSHLYGLDTPLSDKDYKGVVLPTKEQILFGKGNFSVSDSTGDDKSKNSSDDIDTEMFSLQKFLDLACKGETVAIDMLHAPRSALIETSRLWDELSACRSLFYTKNMNAYLGYVKKQAAKYGVKGSRMGVLEDIMEVVDLFSDESVEYHSLDGVGGWRSAPIKLGAILKRLPITEHSKIVTSQHPSTGEQVFYEVLGRKYQSTLKLDIFMAKIKALYSSYGERARQAKDNEGIDWKAISHALRAGYQLYYIYKDGDFTYPLPETQYILEVKQGKRDFTTDVQFELERVVGEVTKLAGESNLPDKVDTAWVNLLIYNTYEAIVTGDKV
jgi:hypothetical protein